MNRTHVLSGTIGIAVLIALAFGIFVWGFNGASGSGLTAAQETQIGTHGPTESVLVHGHWEINILEPDGTLVSSRSFANDLLSIGELTLAEFLSRNKIPGLWRVVFFGSVSGEAPCENANGPIQCTFIEPGDSNSTGPEYQEVLSISRLESTVVLAGQGAAQRDGDIAVVHTTVGNCDPTIVPPTCIGPSFTSTSITPEPVLAGQIIQVEVTLSFGTFVP